MNLRIVGRDSIAERFGALAELRDAGLIRHLGVSNALPAQLAEAQAIPGTGDEEHLVSNMAAGALRLSKDEPAGLGSLHHRAAVG